MAIPGFGEIAEQLRRSTVLIHSGGRGAGSGVIWSSDGVVVTNAHVVRGSRVNVQLWDGREFEAAIRSRDPRRDLAQLRIDAENLPAASAADSSQLRPGELAIAIGNPMGFVGALATGVIHAVGRFEVSGGRRGCRRTCAWRRATPAGRSPTRTAASSASTRWSRAAWRSPFRATRARFSFRGSGKRLARCHGSSHSTFHDLPMRARHSDS